MMIDRISSFRMVRIVSEGERGAFLHGVSEKSGERVAVRVMRGEEATAELEERCLRAVHVSRLFTHPAVVRLVQAGRLPDGSVYLIQEHLLGETLASRLHSRPRLPMNEVLRIGRQIATVLTAAHARGISHRALRPEAVQLVPDPEAIGGERVKLNDWGLAAVPAHGEHPAEAPPVPLDMPTYLAPEQCQATTAGDGRAAASAAPADVYALGVLLFQLVTGQPPFAGRPVSEILAMHIAALPPKLDPKILGMPAGLPALVAAMLIKDQKARPTMHEVEERLLQLLAQQQLAATLTPATPAARDELARALPSISATVQMQAPPDLEALPAPPVDRRVWGLGALLALVFAGGLYWLFVPLFAAPPPTDPFAAPSPSPSPSRPKPAPSPSPRAAPPVMAGSAPVKRVDTAAGARPPGVRYPPLRDARAVAAMGPPRRAPLPPLRAARPASAAKAEAPAAAPTVPAGRSAATPAGRSDATPAGWSDAAPAAAPVVLLAAQTAFESGDYKRAIDGASALIEAQPIAASLLVGKSACAVGDLALARRSYQNLRKSPAALASLTSWCKKYPIELTE